MDAIVAQTQRSRKRSRQSAGVTASQPINNTWKLRTGPTGPFLFVNEFNYSPEVGSGDAVTVEIGVENAAQFVGPGDADRCFTGDGPGLEYEIEIELDGETDQLENCLGNDAFGGGPQHTLDVPAPEAEGSYTLSVTVMTLGSENGGTKEFEVSVVSEEEAPDGRPPTEPINPPNQPGDGGGGDIELPGSGPLIGTPAAIGIGAGLALLLVVLIATR
jgi:hypothetical protein